MFTENLLSDINSKCREAINHLKHELDTQASLKISPEIIAHIKILHHGADMNIRSIASVNVQNAATMTVEPWDKSILKKIESELRNIKDIQVNVGSDSIIYVSLTPITTERRKELCKKVEHLGEKTKITILFLGVLIKF